MERAREGTLLWGRRTDLPDSYMCAVFTPCGRLAYCLSCTHACPLRLPPLFLFPFLFRLQVAAELVALGYNVMSSDLDVAFMRDPYPLLKSGPLARFNLIMRQARADPPNPPSFRND